MPYLKPERSLAASAFAVKVVGFDLVIPQIRLQVLAARGEIYAGACELG